MIIKYTTGRKAGQQRAIDPALGTWFIRRGLATEVVQQEPTPSEVVSAPVRSANEAEGTDAPPRPQRRKPGPKPGSRRAPRTQ